MIAAGIYIKQLREGAGLTQEDLAEMLDVTSRQVRNWERGKSDPGSMHLARLIKELRGNAQRAIEYLLIDDDDAAGIARILESPEITSTMAVIKSHSDDERVALRLRRAADLVLQGLSPEDAMRRAADDDLLSLH